MTRFFVPNRRVGRQDCLNGRPKRRQEVENRSGAGEQVVGRGDPEIGKERVECGGEGALRVPRGIHGQNLVAAREGGDDPEDRLAVVPGPDQLPAPVHGDRPRLGRDIGTEEERGLGGGGSAAAVTTTTSTSEPVGSSASGGTPTVEPLK